MIERHITLIISENKRKFKVVNSFIFYESEKAECFKNDYNENLTQLTGLTCVIMKKQINK